MPTFRPALMLSAVPGVVMGTCAVCALTFGQAELAASIISGWFCFLSGAFVALKSAGA